MRFKKGDKVIYAGDFNMMQENITFIKSKTIHTVSCYGALGFKLVESEWVPGFNENVFKKVEINIGINKYV